MIQRLCAALALVLGGVAATADKAVIDACRYTSDGTAQAVWQPMRDSAPASAAKFEGENVLRLRCNFAGATMERASWDRKVNLNLSAYQGIELRLRIRNVAPVGQFVIYLQSGGGWYTHTFFPDSTTGWNRIELEKANMRTEGRPAGWSKIETIRISAWRGRNEDTEMLLGGIRGYGVLGEDASVAILRADSVSADEAKGVTEFSSNIAAQFSALGIRYATVSDADVTAEMLRSAKLVVLPHNPVLPERAARELNTYLERGGRLLAFYHIPTQLRKAVQIEGGTHVKAELSALRFTPGALAGAPETVGQHSWNFNAVTPVAGVSRTLAEWLDAGGKPTGRAAVIASKNCIFMTHVLLKDDAPNKRRMLMAMVGQLAPDVLQKSVSTAIERIGRVGTEKSFDETVTMLSSAAKKDKAIGADVEAARRMRASATLLAKQGKPLEAATQAASADMRLRSAYARAQRPEAGEFRAFWCHSATGVQGMEWDEAIRRLAENGFTAIVPNMLWAGSASYPSDVLPVAAEVAAKGDQIAQALAACRKYGIQIHVWKVNWNLGHQVPKEFVERMRSEGRLQANSRGQQEPWLCPSHPENQKTEIASMVEVAAKYAVDGIHFDYIRYPDGDHCFCDGCRQRFGKAAGVAMQQWPRDAQAGGAYRQQWLDWRRANITSVVKAVSEQARKARPGIKISAAVFRNWTVDRDGVGQDWKLWCERGYLDFVCPMDYTESDSQFDSWIESQKQWAGKTPVYPGIGESASSARLAPDRVMGQIQITRKHRTGGFVIFNYGQTEASDLLPMLGLGITKPLAKR